MGEAAITQSPYAFDPYRKYTKKEIDDLYQNRIDETYHPYTVIDVLTKVFHRSFPDDLLSYIGEHPDEFAQTGDRWKVSRAWINELRIVRPESVFYQDADDFRVDIVVQGRLRIEETKKTSRVLLKRSPVKFEWRLQYSLNFIPCFMRCHFVKVIIDEKDSLRARDPDSIVLDKYLIPVMGAAEYKWISARVRFHYYFDAFTKNEAIDPMKWIEKLGHRVRFGVFPENGAMGEFFFGFGTADLIDKETGAVNREYINPGTIILNHEMAGSRGILNSTLAHEGTHAYLGRYFFMLQWMHGHDYCSYMCKKAGKETHYD